MATPATALSDLSSRQSQLFFSSRPCTTLKPWLTRVNVRLEVEAETHTCHSSVQPSHSVKKTSSSGTSTASKFLRESGVTSTKVREEALKIIPKGDMYFSPEHPPLTNDAQRALHWALEQKLKSGH